VFLKAVLDHRPPDRNRWAEGIRAGDTNGQFVPGIWRLFAWRPALAEHLARLAHEVLRGPSELTPGFRELIAAFVSARNHCLF
jgi:alkylhydroperoxidase family enzyme